MCSCFLFCLLFGFLSANRVHRVSFLSTMACRDVVTGVDLNRYASPSPTLAQIKRFRTARSGLAEPCSLHEVCLLAQPRLVASETLPRVGPTYTVRPLSLCSGGVYGVVDIGKGAVHDAGKGNISYGGSCVAC